MRHLSKMKKNFVINTVYLPKKEFNEPVYVINSNKEYIEAYSTTKNKVVIKQIKLEDELNDKTFITIKEFFKKCKQDSTEYKIEKVDNGDVYIRVAYLGDLSLFFRLRKNSNILILTNIKKYKFVKTEKTGLEALNKVNYLSEFEVIKLNNYLSNLKNLKRDYIFSLKKSQERLENQYNNEKIA